MIRRALLLILFGSVVWGLVRNIADDPRSGLLGLVALLGLAYIVRRALPSVRADVRALRGRALGRHSGGRRSTRGEGTF